VRRLWSSPTLRSMAVYAASGAGFSGANLILARVLPTEPYALFTLVIALGNLAYSLAPAGLDGVVNRRHLDAGPALLRQVLRTSTAAGLLFGIIGMAAYDMSWPLAVMLAISTVGGGAMMVAGARFQSEQRFGVSLALLQSPNIVLILAAAATAAAHATDAWLPILLSTVGFVAAGAWGWRVLLRERPAKPPSPTGFQWGEALSFAGLAASGLLLIQLERLLIPHALPLADLALYGVLGAIVGSLFRVLQMGVGFSLLPRLRAAASVRERRRLVAHEGQLVGAIVLGGSVLIWFLTPLIERWFLAGKYHLGAPLVAAAIVSGIGKISNAFTKAIAAALAEPRELSLVNACGWVSVATSVAGAFIGARWGLPGLIYGVAVGWFLRAVFAGVLMVRHLRLPVTVPVTAP
jgi:O-antigen/teichoic acid export membrane protein